MCVCVCVFSGQRCKRVKKTPIYKLINCNFFFFFFLSENFAEKRKLLYIFF